MKLFLVVYIFGEVAAAVGPLPYDMATCRNTAIPMIEKMQADGWNASVKNGDASRLHPWKNGKRFRGPADTVNRCEFHEKSPVKNPVSRK